MQIRHVQFTHVGKYRRDNQDALYSNPGRGIFLVADGMGGEKGGAEAAAQVVDTIDREAEPLFDGQKFNSPWELESALREMIENANRSVRGVAERDPTMQGMGSTGSLLCLHRGLYFTAHVGDSRIYRLRGGAIELLTRDHTIVWELFERGMLRHEDMESHPDRHLITRCLGGADRVVVDTTIGVAQAGDIYLLCSDGLTAYAGEAESFNVLRSAFENLLICGNMLVDAALKGGGGDNISVLLAAVDRLEPADDWTLSGTKAAKAKPKSSVYSSNETTHVVTQPVEKPAPKSARRSGARGRRS